LALPHTLLGKGMASLSHRQLETHCLKIVLMGHLIQVICIFLGCSVPMLLRKVKYTDADGQAVYSSFIGECYVYGMMDGEAMDIQRNISDSSNVDASAQEDFRLQFLELGPAPGSILAKEWFVDARYAPHNTLLEPALVKLKTRETDHGGVSALAEPRSEIVQPTDPVPLPSYDSIKAGPALNVREEMELFFSVGQMLLSEGVHSRAPAYIDSQLSPTTWRKIGLHWECVRLINIFPSMLSQFREALRFQKLQKIRFVKVLSPDLVDYVYSHMTSDGTLVCSTQELCRRLHPSRSDTTRR
jgi:hypothetical protein